MTNSTVLKPNPNAAKLHPKEHGAYAMLAIPIATALITTGPTFAGLCIAVAAITGFFAHEPLLVAFGHRGARAQRSTPNAKPLLAVLLLIALSTGCIALIAGTAAVRWTLVICLVTAASSFAVALAGRDRTLLGQLWGIAVLSLPSAAILIAGGTSVATAITIGSVWLLGFSATTMAVRSVIAAQKRQSRWPHVLILAAISLLIAISVAIGAYWTLVTVPMIALSWYLLIAPLPAKYIKRVGWTLVAGTVMTAGLVICTFSAPYAFI